jgi:hypothetical protein
MSAKARMYPDPLPDYIRRDPVRRAECKVYDALAEQLSADYTVFYSRPWLGLAPDGREIDGEIDFVVANPETGFLSIEVKGGGISRDARTEQWTSRGQQAIVHKIKNPVNQARSGKYKLLEKLNASTQWKPRFVRARHGVIFPDSAASSSDLGADMPLKIFAFNEDMRRLALWVEQRMKDPPEAGSNAEQALGPDGIRALEFMLARSFTLRVPLGAALSSDDQKIVLLTDEQYHILEAFSGWKRAAIAGGAGTGKTLLAAEKARRLAREGLKTLLLCYNRPLATFLKQGLEEAPKPDVYSFHEFCGVMAAAARIQVPDTKDLRLLYGKVLPEALFRALEVRSDLRYDAIIVDEGQDFPAEWWSPIELCMRSESDGILYVFYDDNQRVYPSSGRYVSSLPQAPIALSRNIRNAKPIFDLSRPLYNGPRYLSAGPDGTPVEYVQIGSSGALPERLGEIVGRLCVTEKIPPEHVAILSGHDRAESAVGKISRIGRFDTVPADAPRAGALVVDTVRRFKGLDRTVVLLVELDGILDSPELLYVAMTRARLKLVIVGTAHELAVLREMLPDVLTTGNGS